MKVKEKSGKVGLKLNIWKTKIMTSGPITSWQIDGETVETVIDLVLLGSKITVDSDCSYEIKRLAPWKKSNDKPRQYIKNKRHYFANKCPSNQSYGFSSSHVWVWELDNKKGWVLKNWCLQTVVLEKTIESPLDCKEIKPVTTKGNQSWVFIRRIDVKVEAPVLWPPDMKSRLTGKDPDAGNDWSQEKGMTEDVITGWHHWLTGHHFYQNTGDGKG